jgi:cobalt/nickel transport system ATP-binding protein
MNIMEAIDLTYFYPGAKMPALQNLSFCIPAGKKTVLLGHNGCGKSTFFLQAIGIDRPQKGQILWKGIPLSYKRKDLMGLRQKVGLVFQDPEQQLILGTPRDDISYGLRNANVSEAEIKIRTENILLHLGLMDIADTPIHQLSLGQKKRVSLAGVMVLEPELLLLDEPTAYLDRASERQLLAELNRIHQQGTSILMATHDMNVAYEWADWVIVMDQGKCLMEGSPDDVLTRGTELNEIGLETPYLYQIWQSLPDWITRDCLPPRTISAFQETLAKVFIPSGKALYHQ